MATNPSKMNEQIERARLAIRAQAPYNVKRETRWQYEARLAKAAVEALKQEEED